MSDFGEDIPLEKFPRRPELLQSMFAFRGVKEHKRLVHLAVIEEFFYFVACDANITTTSRLTC